MAIHCGHALPHFALQIGIAVRVFMLCLLCGLPEASGAAPRRALTGEALQS